MTLKNLIRGGLASIGIIKKPDLIACRVIDMPARDELVPGVAVIVGPAKQPKWVTFPCPTGCGETLLLSLSESRRPRWSVGEDWLGRVTLHPSVRRTDGCKCHFWLVKGSINWCEDTGR